jgi:hypothetical protein
MGDLTESRELSVQPRRHTSGRVADAIELRKKRRQRAKDDVWISRDARFELAINFAP